jgi:hypothetical protein
LSLFRGCKVLKFLILAFGSNIDYQEFWQAIFFLFKPVKIAKLKVSKKPIRIL